MLFNFRIVVNILSLLLILNGAFMFLCVPFSLYFGDGDLMTICISAVLNIIPGGLLFLATKNTQNKEMKKRDGYLVVTFGWVIISFFGALPYLIGGYIPNLADAVFETISGYSTTGATVLKDIEAVGKGILFWRSLTHWIGGMGIIVLTVAILPILGIGGMQLFVAEAPGVSPDKLQPRIKETAKRLWLIYIGLTVAETILLLFGGMTFYDAINHSMATIATGGFSTKNASIAYYTSPFIHYVIITFMFLAGTNFTMAYFALHGRFKKVFSNDEFRYYLGFCIGLSLLVASAVIYQGGAIEKSFREATFSVVSIITTTGFVIADYTSWSAFITLLFFIMMFFGASAGSTAGGVKIVRHIILIKNSILELKRQLHPAAVIPVRFNGKAVPREITFNILAFIMIYISIFALGSVFMGALGADFETSIGSVATCLGNIGPGLGSTGPIYNFSGISDGGKWLLSFLMLLGRLELFTVLMLFTPYFWKTN